MDTEEVGAVPVPIPVVFEEVNDDHLRREDHVNIAFRHTADGGNNGVIFPLKDGQDVNVVVEEGGSTANGDNGQPGSGYTMIRHEEVKLMREELEEAKKIVERQIVEMDKAKEMIMEQQARISELEMGRGQEGCEKCAQRVEKENKNAGGLNGKIEDLEKTIEGLKKAVRDKEEKLHQKELMLLQKDADHDTVKTMNISEVSTLKKLLSDEREKRVIAEMQVKMLLGSIEPVKYLESREREKDGKKTGNELPLTPRTPSPPVATSSRTENMTVVDNGGDEDDDDDDVLFIEEVEKESGNGEVADADSGYPRCDSENESKKVDDLMNQKFVCKACGLVCTTNLNLMKHIRNAHGQPTSQWPSNTSVNREPNDTRTPTSYFSVPSTSTSPHNLRRRTPPNTVLINDIRRSSSSSPTSSVSDHWTNDGKGKFICTLCEARYPIVSKLKTHMKHAHGIEDDKFSIGCKDCGIIFYSRKDHILHRRITHGTKYNGRGRGRKPSTLTRPSSSGPTPTATQPERNDEEAPVLLPEAGSSTQTFKNHAVDIKRLRFGCFCTCGLEFRTTSHIKIHIKLCNKSDQILPPIPTPPQNAVSLELGSENEEFESKMVIDKNGMRILTIQPPPSTQQRHRIVGVDPKVHRAKYYCACGKIYYNRASFQIHAKSKNMGRIFKCGWCTMSFDLHGNLKSHVRTYHKAIYGNGKFACGNCAQTFDTSRQLSRHRIQDCMNK